MPFNALVLAQTESPLSNVIYLLAVFVCGFVLPILAGRFLAKQFRAAEYGWKISLVLVLLVLAGMTIGRSWDPATGTFKIPLGVDLKGGVILIYEVDDEARLAQDDGTEGPAAEGRIKMDALISALSRRINPSGTKEIVLRKYGDRQVEIIIPEVDTLEVEIIKKKIRTAGMLMFRIVANRRDHDETIALATEMANDPLRKRSAIVRDAGNREVGLWARIAREEAKDNIDQPLKLAVSSNDLVRDASTGELLDWTLMNTSGARDSDSEIANLQAFLDTIGTKEIDVLMATDDGFDVTGADLGVVSQGTDEYLNPCINFNLKGSGVDRFADLTGDNEPDGNFHRQLGILLDNQLLSAPNIQEMITGRGRITGKFTQDEVVFMVNILDAGSLPMVLNPVPISDSRISPLLGQQTIKQGRWAIVISLSAVLVFIVLYYRFAGIVASLALLANLLFILAMMITINAAFTLPGLAGLVLTVGMSVDANVLIFERIREEITKGSALRMAIRNGFGRATTTIVDANVTTLITAIVLYAIGTDQIRGFAVTLILGILMSMFTAIFCSRIIFDLAEKSRRLLSLNMSQLVGATQFDFIGKRQLAAIFSVVVIAAGIVGLTLRGADIFDIDFRGGTSVQLTLNREMETDEVRASLGPKFSEMGVRYTLSAMNSGGSDNNSVFKVDSAIAEVGDLQMAIQEALKQPDGKSLLATYSLDIVEMRTVAKVTPETTDESKTGTSAGGATTDAETDAETDVSPPDTTPADQNPVEDAVPAAESDAQPAKEAEGPKPAAETIPPSSDPAASAPSKEPTTAADPAPSADGTPGAGAPPTPVAGETPAPSGAPAPDDGARFSRSTDTDNLLAMADDLATLIAQAEPEETPTEAATTETTASQPPATEASPTTTTSPPTDEEKPAAAEDEPSATTPTGGEEAPAADPTSVTSSQVEVDLAFEHAINKDTLSSMITTAMEQRGQTVFFELFNADYDRGSNAFKTWRLQIPGASEAQTQQLLDQLQSQFADKPVWQSSNKIGGQVAGKMQRTAILALLTSLLGIILYIWIRFQRVIFGLAAVVALVHDVLVTLGAIALSYWLAGVFGFLLIEEFKISLPIVAALLTIIGYSLNDTIVVFDRIREVRGKSPDLTGDMINRSINQTLSRTILTSFTTLIVVLILYFIGGDGIHGFAFALVVGVTVGTYSSIFVASPALLWMTGANKSRQRSKAA